MLELGSPWALAALLVVPALLILHSLRPRRTQRRVPSTRLWREALRERQRGLGLQRLLRDLSLLLLLLAALALALALADPRWLGVAAGPRELVLVLDTSASMQARAGRTTRFERARDRALELVEAQPVSARALVMTSGRSPQLHSAFEADRAVLGRILRSLEPSDEAGRPREALALALRLLHDPDHGRVVFLTDAAFDAEIETSRQLVVENVAGEQTARNVAISRFDFRPEVGTRNRYEALLVLRNYDPESRPVSVEVTLEGAPLLERRLVLGKHARETLVVPFAGLEGGRARATLRGEDDLEADNEAFAVVPEEGRLRVLMFGAPSLFLESAFAALPRVELTRLEEFRQDRFAAQRAAHDVVVFYRIPPPVLERGRYLLIDALAPGLPFSVRGWVERPAVTGRGQSALLDDIDLSGVRIDRARRVRIPPSPDERPAGLQRLFWSDTTELGLAYLARDLRVVFLGFDVADSTLPLQAAFPLFLEQTFDWLAPRGSRYAVTQIRAGERVSLRTAAETPLVVEAPSRRYELEVAGEAAVFEHTSEAGIYAYHGAGPARYFAVNPAGAEESDLRPRARLGTLSEATAPVPVPLARSARMLWPWLVALALLALVAESALVRRTADA